MKLDGPGLNTDSKLVNGGYQYSSMLQIWRAANATNSHVMMWWNVFVDTFASQFEGTDYSLQAVQLPEPLPRCVNNRPDAGARCDLDVNVRRGEKAARCDYESSQLTKLISKTIPDNTTASSDADKSPAYQLIKNLQITQFSVLEIYKKASKTDPKQGKGISFF